MIALPDLRICCIVNPTGGGGAAASLIPKLEKALTSATPDHFEIVKTTKRGDATTMLRAKLSKAMLDNSPIDVVVSVGGDGTIHEVVNGLFLDNMLISPHTKLAILSAGTGGDLARVVPSFTSVQKLVLALDRLESIHVDVAHVSKKRTDCDPSSTSPSAVIEMEEAPTAVHEYFVNVCSFGLSYDTLSRTDKLKKTWLRHLGGKVVYMTASALALLSMRLRNVRMMLDNDGVWHSYSVCVLAIANGRYFGGGMCVAPAADPTDQRLDITVWRESFCGFLFGLASVYNGNHIKWASTRQHRAREIRLEALDGDASTVQIDLDGELTMTLPVTIQLVPQRVAVVTESVRVETTETKN
eukprot:PhM_4_TR17526/c2_g1_i1/m.3800